MDELSLMAKEHEIIFENNCSVIAVFRIDNTSLYFERGSSSWNQAFGCTEDDYGKRAQEVLPRDVLSLLPFQSAADAKEPIVVDAPHVKALPPSYYKQAKLIPITWHGDVIKIICYFPISPESVSMQNNITDSAAEFDALFDATGNAIWVTLVRSGSFLTERCNKAFYEMFFPDIPYPLDMGRLVELHQTLLPHFINQFEILLQTGQSQRFTLNINLRGFSRTIEIHLVPVTSVGTVTKIVGFALDRTEEIDYLREVEYISQHDPLTGLYDRRYMDNHIAKCSGKRTAGMFAAMFDLDGLKIINDAFGHAAGDMHILAASQEISGMFSDCTVSRLGGDEFLVLGGGLSEEKLAQRMTAFTQPFIIKGCPLPVSISAGYSFYRQQHKTLYHTIRAAEIMMYETKMHHAGPGRRGYLKILRKVLTEKFPQKIPQTDLMLCAASWLSDILNLSQQERENLLTAIPLLDLGKLADQLSLFTKKQRSKRDTLKISTFEEMGAYIAKCAKLPEQVYDAIRYQHHWYDGTCAAEDAPRGLQIPLFGRMTALLLEYSAIVISGGAHAEIITKLQQLSDSRLDPQLVETFLKIL